jgi:hypothetical protein
MRGTEVVLLPTGFGELALVRPPVDQPVPSLPRTTLPRTGIDMALDGALADPGRRAALRDLLGLSLFDGTGPETRRLADALAAGAVIALLLPWRPERPLLVVQGQPAVPDLPMRPVPDRARARAREALEGALDLAASMPVAGAESGPLGGARARRRGPGPLLPQAAQVLGAWSADPLVGAAEAVRAMQRICAAPEHRAAPYVAALWLEAAAARLRGRQLDAVGDAAEDIAEAAALLGWPCLFAALVQMAEDFPRPPTLPEQAAPPEPPAAPPPPAASPPQGPADQPAQAAALRAAALAGVPFVSSCDLEAM